MAVVIPQVVTEDRASGAQVIDGGVSFPNYSRAHLTWFKPTSAGNSTNFTVSLWFRKTDPKSSYQQPIWTASPDTDNNNYYGLYIGSNQLRWHNGNASNVQINGTKVLRDNTWYHIHSKVFVQDSTTYVQVYVNGKKWGHYQSASAGWWNNTSYRMDIGSHAYTGVSYTNCFTQVYHIDGQSLEPESFGYMDPVTKLWKPKSFDPVNDGRVYCADGGPQVTSNYTIQNSGENLFTGGVGVRVYVTGTDPYILYTPDKPIRFKHSLKARTDTNSAGGATVQWVLNGDTTVASLDRVAAATSPYQYTTIVDGPGELRSLKIQVTGGSNGASQNATFNAIKIDDIELINSNNGFGTNGFYLPMDGKSSNIIDKSPNGNDFKSEGLRSNTTLDRATGAIPILKTNGGGFNSSGLRTIHETFNVTVVSTGEGNKYFLNGVKVNSLPLYRGGVYKFDQSDASNGTGGTHPLRFATAADAAGSTEYTDGVTQNGTPGTAGAYTLIVVPHNAPDTLYYYCTNHGGMGGPTTNTTDILKADPYAWKCVLALPMDNLAASNLDERDYSGYLRGVARKDANITGSLDTNSQYSNFYGKSGVFGGGFYIHLADNTDFTLSNNDFTIEVWLRPTYNSGSTYAAGHNGSSFTVADTAWYLEGNNASDKPGFLFQATDGTNWYALGAGYPHGTTWTELNAEMREWNHVAVVRKGNNFRQYVNGVVVSENTYNFTMLDVSNALSVGRAGEFTSNYFQGHMCDFRMYNGVAKYEENFTVPSQNSLTVNKDTPQGLAYGSQKKVTSGSYNMGFGGKGFVVYPPSSDLVFAGDFTFEMYVNTTKAHFGPAAMTCPLQIGNYGGSGMAVWGHPHFQTTINGNNKQDQALYTGDNTQYYTANIKKGGWVHLAMTRTGTTVRCFVDGQIVQSFTESGTVSSSTLRTFVGTYSGDGIAPVTGASGTNQNWTGNLKFTDLHLVNGTCLYTTNFIPPIEPIQPVANTKLLCMNRFDNITQCIRGTVEPNYTTTTAYAMWPLDSDINDDSGNNRTLTENGGSTTFSSAGSNPFGLTNAAYFNRNNKYVSYAVSPATEYSIDFYIKPTYTTGNSYIAGWNGTDGNDQTIGSNNSPAEAAAQTGVPFNGSGATWSVWGSANMYTREPIVLDQWVHIRFCKTNTENHNFYLNGRLIGSAATDQGATSPLTFGDCQNGRFAGYIAGIRYVEKDLGAPDPDNLPVTTNGVLPVSGLVPKPSYGVVHNNGEKPKFMACLNSDNPYSDNINEVLAPSTGHSMLIANTASIYDDGTTVKSSGDGSSWDNIDSTIAVSSGKWYWEVNPIDIVTGMIIGVGKIDSYNGGRNDTYPGQATTGGSGAGLQQNGNLRWDGTQTAEFLYGVEGYNENSSLQYGEGNIIGVCLDLDAGRIYWHVDGKFAGGATPGDKGGCTPFNITGGYWRPVMAINKNGNAVVKVNFGQRPFAYQPPEGYKTLCRTNTRPTSAVAANPKDHFKVLLSPGTGITQSSATELAGVFSRYLYGSDETFYQKGGVPEQEFINTSYLAHQAFNGNTGNGANFGTGAVGANWGYFLPEPGIDGITSMRIWTVNVSELRVNGEIITSSITNGSWYTISNPPSTLTEIAVKGNSGVTSQINAIEINGKVLRDISILQLCKDTFPKGLWWMKSRFTESAESYDMHMLMNNTTGNYMSSRPWDGTTGITDAYRTYTAPTNECVAWCWSAPEAWTGTTNYVANSGYRNTAAGFSMWQYTGNGVRGNTTSHGLSQRPDFIIVQQTNSNNRSMVYHAHLGASPTNVPDAATYPNIDYGVTFDSGTVYGPDAGFWGSTAPSDTLVTLGENTQFNQSGGTYQAYAWHEVEGYSRFGRYMGLQSSQTPAETENGSFIWCGFKPAAVWIKGTGAAEGWVFRDGERSPDNPNFKQLNQSLAQESTSTFPIDFYSDGFKIRTSDGTMNYTSSGAYIFAAWAEVPSAPIYGPTPNAR